MKEIKEEFVLTELLKQNDDWANISLKDLREITKVVNILRSET